MKCRLCANPLGDESYCPRCGGTVPPEPVPESERSLVGRRIADRYVVLELLRVGGMGTVYRARCEQTGEEIALKAIHARLASSPEAVSRFTLEAEIGTFLDHSNIIRIDGVYRVPPEQGHLLLAMELLRGPSLSTLLRDQWPLEQERVVDILCQTLDALGEAHLRCITHRDVKPGNILIEQAEDGGDLVKLIDFGIARLARRGPHSVIGEALGTPSYMSPEQALGQDVGPSSDLYAVGVILFQMLTGAVPFAGSPRAILEQHISAPRPDPRLIAPDRMISSSLAAVCVRALDVSPKRRFATAEAFARALHAATTTAPWSQRAGGAYFRNPSPAPSSKAPSSRSPFPKAQPSRKPGSRSPFPEARPSRAPSARSPLSAPPSPRAQRAPTPSRRVTPASAAPSSFQRDDRVTDDPTVKTTLFQPVVRSELPPRGDEVGGFVGREACVTWAMDTLREERGVMGAALCGRPGVGKTRLLAAVATAAARRGAVVLRCRLAPPPISEVSYAGLRALVTRLVGATASDSLLISGKAASADEEAAGLRAIFATDPEMLAEGAQTDHRREAAAALRWAAVGSAEAVAPRPIVLVIDDIDHMDHVSQNALADVLCETPIAGVHMIVTARRPPVWWSAAHLHTLRIKGLSLRETRRLLEEAGAAPFDGAESDVEPLLIEQRLRWSRQSRDRGRPPALLAELVEIRMRRLAPALRGLLQAIAMAGEAPVASLGHLVSIPENMEETIASLEADGWITEAGGRVRIAHTLYGEVASALAPPGATSVVHARIAKMLDEGPGPVELRAFHAVRGRPNRAALGLVEQSASLRERHGDALGAISALRDGVRAARMEVVRGEHAAEDAWTALAARLGAVLIDAGHDSEATDVLRAALSATRLDDRRRARILEQLARAAAARDQMDDAETMRREALAIAEKTQDDETVSRLQRPLIVDRSGSRHIAGPQSEKPNKTTAR